MKPQNPPPQQSNIIRRWKTALAAIPVIVLCLCSHTLLACVVSVICFVGLYEFFCIKNEMLIHFVKKDSDQAEEKTLPTKDRSLECKLKCALGTSIVVFAYFTPASSLSLFAFAIMFVVCILFVWGMACDGHAKPSSAPPHPSLRSFISLSIEFLGTVYIAGGLSTGLILHKNCGVALLMVLLTNWLGDAVALFTGKFLGKRKLFPRISPNKTVEGFLGALVASAWCCTTLMFLHRLFLPYTHPYYDQNATINNPTREQVNLLVYIPIGVMLGVLGSIGDLCESYVKRLGKVKDSGDFFPAHGGVLDRIDGLFFQLPAAFLVYTLFLA